MGGSVETELPGFRFHPTEEELLDFYLKNMVTGKKLRFDIIDFLNIYHHDPWDLPGMAKVGEREWYFLVPRDRKHGSGGRPNRTTQRGFWKATGSDRKIVSLSDPKRVIGLRKTLVFYEGRAPRGTKTDWVMNEYRLPDTFHFPNKDTIVLCKIYRKATSLKVLEQRAAMEGGEIMKPMQMAAGGGRGAASASPSSSPASSSNDAVSFTAQLKTEVEEMVQVQPPHQINISNQFQLPAVKDKASSWSNCSKSTPQLPIAKEKPPALQLPTNPITMDCTQDPFWSQLNSPAWLQCLTPYSNILNF